MVVALSVGACPGGALAALKGCLLERTLEKGCHHQKRFRRPFFSDLKALSHSERGVCRKSAVLSLRNPQECLFGWSRVGGVTREREQSQRLDFRRVWCVTPQVECRLCALCDPVCL